MNREYYDSLSESYQAIYEKEGGHDYSQIGRGLQKAASAGQKVAKSYGKGLFQNKKVNSKANPAYRASNLVGRVANTLTGGMAKRAVDTAKAAGKLYKGAEKYVKDSAKKTRRGWAKSTNEEVDALMALGFNEDEAVGILSSLIEQEMNEGLPEPKVNYLKDMDPYDPRRARRQHAPGSPLPPPTPGLPERMLNLKRAKVNKPNKIKKA